MSRSFAVLLVVAVVTGVHVPGGLARGGIGTETPQRAGVVTLGKIPIVTVHPGETTAVVIPVLIADGYHVQANPASGEFLIPLELDLGLGEPDSLLSWEVRYPPPQTFRLEGTTDDLLTYHDSIGVEVAIFVMDAARKGERTVTGRLRYQACDAKRCLFPAWLPVTLPIAIVND